MPLLKSATGSHGRFSTFGAAVAVVLFWRSMYEAPTRYLSKSSFLTWIQSISLQEIPILFWYNTYDLIAQRIPFSPLVRGVETLACASLSPVVLL
jgi:hypothetical protein